MPQCIQHNLLNFSRRGLAEFLQAMNEAPFRMRQLSQWIHQRGIVDFDQMTDLSKICRDTLKNTACITLPEIITDQIAQDGTRKWLLRLFDGNAIEMVFIPEKTRGTLCVSSQVGCALNCSFCSTGKEGFNRNLSHAEIIGQLFLANKLLRVDGPGSHFKTTCSQVTPSLSALENEPSMVRSRIYPDATRADKEDVTCSRDFEMRSKTDRVITNVVMMGMGEPLLNYQPVIDAMDWMTHDLAYRLSKYRVTLSTSGVVPMMQQLKKDSPVSLAVSLHAPTNELRNVLVPLNKKYPLEVLMPACRDYFSPESDRVVVFEYVMLKNVNDSLTHAKQLIRLLDNMPCKVNLIPFNPFPGTEYTVSDWQTILDFQNRLKEAGVKTFIRKKRGDDIDGACGQLAGDFRDRTGRNERWLRRATKQSRIPR